MRAWPLWLAALWWGGMSAVSFVVVPTLFARLGPAVAGPVAAQLFALQSTGVIVVGLALLMWLRQQRRRVPAQDIGPLMGTMALVLLAMFAALLQEFAVAERIVSARSTGGDLRLWHGLGSALVFVQWLCGAWVFKRLIRSAF
ncbi:MAG: DUF4149 domain-containing protein [Hydrogenophaga sp.]|nr:DUF4149 domain-containing protein [Hydrogenophaga sp.]